MKVYVLSEHRMLTQESTTQVFLSKEKCVDQYERDARGLLNSALPSNFSEEEALKQLKEENLYERTDWPHGSSSWFHADSGCGESNDITLVWQEHEVKE